MIDTKKMHKSPIGTKIKIENNQCINKHLSKSIIAAFKLLYKSVQIYHNKSKFYSGVDCFSLIQNNAPVIDTLNKLIKQKAATSVSAYDV